MARPAFIVVALLALGVAGVLGYSLQSNRKSPGTSDPERESSAKSLTRDAALPSHATSGAEQVASPVQAHAGPPQLTYPQSVSPQTLGQWIADANSDDSKARAAALIALAEAPKSQAVPVLDRVLQVGEPQVDRQIALRSLHTLALEQGDADGRIREVLRRAIYHGDDEGASQSAQAVLEDLEIEFADADASR